MTNSQIVPPQQLSMSAKRLGDFRQLLREQNLDGFLVPNTDEHQGEYCAPYRERLAFLTAFKGTAGFLIVLPDDAALFVDGRYILQASQQVDPSVVKVFWTQEVTPQKWLTDTIKEGMRIGFDPWVMTERAYQAYKTALDTCGATLASTQSNPIDTLWVDQPAAPLSKARVHPVSYAGEERAQKIERLQETLKKVKVEAYATSFLECIAWLLNIRGGDIDVFPVVMAHLIVQTEGMIDLYVDSSKITQELRSSMQGVVTIHPYDAFTEALEKLGRAQKKVLIDPETNAVQLIFSVEGAGGSVLRQEDPCLLPKAIKNTQEIKGAINAHIKDGAALVNFLAWLSLEVAEKDVDELRAVHKLLKYRQEQALFQSVSFETISSAGPNGAIVHYRVDEATNRSIRRDDIYLVDSGGQYLDGTTDVTRTVCFSPPTDEQKDRFTRVLKGHIAIASLRFPKGTTGSQMDCLARAPLWAVGLDYAHGTGHGVGSYLGVHEGPQRISMGPSRVPLVPGMILSNEPGYYKEGAYGIRIESLVVVREAEVPSSGDTPFYAFETLTLAPIDLNLIETNLLTQSERNWLNDYHTKVRTTLMPLVHEETRPWLCEATHAL
jgi:Xaa-Pro aminopeptidase